MQELNNIIKNYKNLIRKFHNEIIIYYHVETRHFDIYVTPGLYNQMLPLFNNTIEHITPEDSSITGINNVGKTVVIDVNDYFLIQNEYYSGIREENDFDMSSISDEELYSEFKNNIIYDKNPVV